MSELVGPDGQAPAEPVFQLLIEYRPNSGQVRVNGNALSDGILARGILKLGEELLHDMSRKAKEDRRIEPVTGGLAQQVLKRKDG